LSTIIKREDEMLTRVKCVLVISIQLTYYIFYAQNPLRFRIVQYRLHVLALCLNACTPHLWPQRKVLKHLKEKDTNKWRFELPRIL